MTSFDDYIPDHLTQDDAAAALGVPVCMLRGHYWEATDNWLIDRCSVCGEEQA